MEAIIEKRLSEINKAARYVDQKRIMRANRRILYFGLVAYCAAAAVVGWWIGTGGF